MDSILEIPVSSSADDSQRQSEGTSWGGQTTQQQQQQQQQHLFSTTTSYNRQSFHSLASSLASEDDDYYTACEEQEQTTLSWTPSWLCMEDVIMEEEEQQAVAMNSSSNSNSSSNNNYNNNKGMTTARLALTSDIGMLHRSSNSSNYRGDEGTSSSSYDCKKMAAALMERDALLNSPRMTATSFFGGTSNGVTTTTTPNATVTSHSCYSHASIVSSDDEEEEDESDSLSDMQCEEPSLLLEEDDEDFTALPTATTKPLQFEDLADDIHLQILSFLTVDSARAIMATKHSFRNLLLSPHAQTLWTTWCQERWPQFTPSSLVLDDLSLPTAARPSPLQSTVAPMHQQANLAVLLSMAQSQPTQIDLTQLNQYVTWRRRVARRHNRLHRVHTLSESQEPLLKYFDAAAAANHTATTASDINNNKQQLSQQMVVQFKGRVGQGDRCVRSQGPLPRPTLIKQSSSSTSSSPSSSPWKRKSAVVPYYYSYPRGIQLHHNHNHHHHSTLMDLFCRGARAVMGSGPAWKPFVAPFLSKEGATHLTPRFISYFEVSILEPQQEEDQQQQQQQQHQRRHSNDCVAVGLATEYFDWHARMPGWDASSFGYHGDDGGIFHSSGGMLRKFGPSYGRGDVVGCGIDYVMQGIFFTLNGHFLGYGWTGLSMDLLLKDLYPVVGIDTNDYIHCNYGTEPFQFDLKSMVVRHEDLVHQSLTASRASS